VPQAAPSEADRARELFNQSNLVAALPLYEDLAAQDPTSAVYAERFAFCLVGKASSLPTGEERKALVARAITEANRAKTLGDNSPLLQVILSSLPGFERGSDNPLLDTAEAAFTRGDLDAALAGYMSLAQTEPNSYEPRLFAGDVYFRKKDVAHAGEWFQKAIDLDPDRETAYRYWGDALDASGDTEGALARFIDAVVAQPYDSKPWMGLSQWAKRHGATVTKPHVPVPKAPAPTDPTGGKPGMTISIDAASLNKPKVGAVWLVYSITRVQWRDATFAKRFPGESYRHSLAEEVESLQAALVVGTKDTAVASDPDVRDLVQLGKEGMVEPYVLLNAADDGIAADYPAYRASHRRQLHEYVQRFLIHRDSQ
jgi:tetratricopeptide (TPR) repeat protein